MKPERTGGAMHRAINRFLDRVPRGLNARDRGIRLVNGYVCIYWRSHIALPGGVEFNRLMRLFRRLHGDWQ